LGASKAASAAAACRALNSLIAVAELPAVTPATAVATAKQHDLLVDCTDNAAARYMLSDAAVAARVPLVSGAAVGTEGQVSVLCGARDASGRPAAPCYRCLYRAPAPPSACARCADAGVLGPVPGVIGTLQAVEALKVLSGVGAPLRGALLLYDAFGSRPFMLTQLAPPDARCPACGEAADAALSGDGIASYDYAAFVAGPASAPAPALPPPPPRVTCGAYAALAAAGGAHLLLDVRPGHLADVATLQGAHLLPFKTPTQFADDFAARFPEHTRGDAASPPVFLLCRRGNQSQKAAHALIAAGVRDVADIIGGVTAWRTEVDPTFPL
jgi:adenylyltransferase/sulfurtransferase